MRCHVQMKCSYSTVTISFRKRVLSFSMFAKAFLILSLAIADVGLSERRLPEKEAVKFQFI